MPLAIIGASQFLFLFIGALVGILILTFYLLNLQDTLKQVHPDLRQMPPANVWLMFIPLFSIVYAFIMYPKICDSVKAEYARRGLPERGDFGKNLGLAMAILGVCGMIPMINSLAAIAGLILVIIFWTKMAEFKNELRRNPNISNGVHIGSSEDLLDN